MKTVKTYHDGMRGKVSQSGQLSVDLVIGNGVKQDDPFAPTFFTLFFFFFFFSAVLEKMAENLL